MNGDHLDEVAALERVCFPDPWSRSMLAEELDNALSACTLHSEVSVISPEEAYSRLCAGWINRPEAYYFEHSDAGEVRVTACTLEYIADTKGFRQPVYYFTLSDDYDEALRGGSAWRAFVPARA